MAGFITSLVRSLCSTFKAVYQSMVSRQSLVGLSSVCRPLFPLCEDLKMTESQPINKRGVRVTQEWLKYATTLLLLLSFGVGEVFGAATTYTFTSTTWGTSQSAWTSDKAGTQTGDSRGIAIQAAASGAGAHTASISNITKVAINCSRSSNGVGSISVKVGNTEVISQSSFNTTDTQYESSDLNSLTGSVSFTVTCTTSTIYVKSITITTASGSTYTITYDCDDADSGCPSTASGQTALPNPLPASPIKAGYEFNGWYTNSTKTTAAVAGASLSGDVTLYAKWVSCHEATTIFYPDQGSKPSAGSYNYVGVHNPGNNTNVNTASTNSLTGQTFTSCNGTQISFSHSSGSSYNTIWYASSTYDIRLYQNNPVTFTAPTGYIVKSVSKTVGATTTSLTSNNSTSSYSYTKSGSGGEAVKYFTVTIEATCTALGQINGSINLSIDPTSSSITVSVETEGVNAYGDAANVSGYEFKLYTAASGGSATATYSSNSSAETSHTFTGLSPLTQYWVTVRPIGSGSYCNTTAESNRVGVYTDCTSPHHVDISGRWDRFGGETISLTATAYSTDGTGSPIAAAKITGYQWQKFVTDHWENVSNGTSGGATIAGATTNNLQITNCTASNSGSYRCVVSTVADCDIESDGFQVKVYVLECYTGGTTVYNFTRVGDTQAGTVQVPLTTANTGYTFKVHADDKYYGNNGTINEDVTNWVLCSSNEAVCTTNLTINSGLGGTFTINMDYSTDGNSSVEGEPEISVIYPRKTIYISPGVWDAASAQFAIYYYSQVGEVVYGKGFTDFISVDDCGSSADIPQWNGVKMIPVRFKPETTASDLANSANNYKAAWDLKWNKTSDITVTANDYVTITDWEESDYTYTAYSIPTYTISYAKGSTTYTNDNAISGSKSGETKTCAVDFTLPGSAVFTTTGYTQTGWTTTDGGSQTHALGGSYTTNDDQAFYPVWTANNYTLTWNLNGGKVTTAGTGAAVNATGSPSSSVAYATAITAPIVEKTGYTQTGWSPSLSATMPADNTTYVAQWTNAVYTVTLNTNGGTINAGDVTSYTYGTEATLPTNVTRDDYRFDGWYANSDLSTGGVQTTISTSATGAKEYWAKWTRIWPVDWYVGGSAAGNKLGDDGQTVSVANGGKITALPATEPDGSACEKTFVGWTNTTSYVHGTSLLFTDVAGSPTIEGATNFYAVFATESGGGSWSKVTAISGQLASGDTVAFIRYGDDYYLSNSSVTNKTGATCTAVTKTAGKINFVAAMKFIATYDDDSEGFTFRSVSTTTDTIWGSNDNQGLRITNSINNSGKTKIWWLEDYDDENSTSTGWGIVLYCNAYTTGNNFRYFSSYGTQDWRLYTSISGDNKPANIYHKSASSYSEHTITCAGCSANADASSASTTIETSFTLNSLTDAVSVSTADWAVGVGCSWSDYGFVWGTTSTPTVSDNKVQVGTSGKVTEWNSDDIQPSNSTTPSAWTVGTTYYMRAYGKNGWESATYQYTNAASFILRSITYNSNGGSDISTQYVNSGGTYSAPTPPTRTGYNFSNWYTDSGLETPMDWSSAISDNKNLYAKWTAKTSTVTLDKNGGTTSSNQTVTATYDAEMPLETTSSVAIDVPTKTAATLLGYWDTDAASGGTQYYYYDGSTLSSTTNWDKETATVTLYARWEDKVDYYIDDMHRTTGYTGAGMEMPGAGYEVPGPFADSKAGNVCETEHYIFVGWVSADDQNADGTLKGTPTIVQPGEFKDASGTTYYAVWAEE